MGFKEIKISAELRTFNSFYHFAVKTILSGKKKIIIVTRFGLIDKYVISAWLLKITNVLWDP